MTRMAVTTLAALVLTGPAAHAQRPPAAPPAAQRPQAPRLYVSIDGGYQAGTEDFRNGGTFTQYLEEARFDSAYEVEPGPQFRAAGGVRLWRRLHAGVAVSRFTQTTPTRVTGAIPHPFFFSRPRDIEGSVAGLRRKEAAVHLQARAVVPISGRIDLAAFAGPSWFSVEQGVVGAVQYGESYPFDTAEFRSATTMRRKVSRAGFNVGGDVAFFVLRNVGVGASVQFARANVTLPGGDATDVDTNAGGVQGGVGLRLRF